MQHSWEFKVEQSQKHWERLRSSQKIYWFWYIDVGILMLVYWCWYIVFGISILMLIYCHWYIDIDLDILSSIYWYLVRWITSTLAKAMILSIYFGILILIFWDWYIDIGILILVYQYRYWYIDIWYVGPPQRWQRLWSSPHIFW